MREYNNVIVGALSNPTQDHSHDLLLTNVFLGGKEVEKEVSVKGRSSNIVVNCMVTSTSLIFNSPNLLLDSLF